MSDLSEYLYKGNERHITPTEMFRYNICSKNVYTYIWVLRRANKGVVPTSHETRVY